MNSIDILYYSNQSGQDKWDKILEREIGRFAIKKVKGSKIVSLLQHKNAEFEEIDSNEEYYVYYNFHRSSGFKSHITYENNAFTINVIPPTDGVFPAFFSEIIIFKKDA